MVKVYFSNTNTLSEFTLIGWDKIVDYFADPLIRRQTPGTLFKYLQKSHSRTEIANSIYELHSCKDIENGDLYVFYKSI